MSAIDAKPTATKLDWRTIITATDETPASIVAALDGYFAAFAQPALAEKDGRPSFGNLPCLKCDEPLADGLLSFLRGKGGFIWGLAHGEGYCRNCHWPARAHHFIKAADGAEIATLRYCILQYHPDHVEIRPSRQAEDQR